jgi:putative endonuclease
MGDKGEDIAAKYLQKKGYEIIERNWQFEKLEIDIIAKVQNLYVFVEVKTRKNEVFGFPEEAVDQRKAEKIIEAADIYLSENEIENEIRFDIVSVILNENLEKVYHIEDGF